MLPERWTTRLPVAGSAEPRPLPTSGPGPVRSSCVSARRYLRSPRKLRPARRNRPIRERETIPRHRAPDGMGRCESLPALPGSVTRWIPGCQGARSRGSADAGLQRKAWCGPGAGGGERMAERVVAHCSEWRPMTGARASRPHDRGVSQRSGRIAPTRAKVNPCDPRRSIAGETPALPETRRLPCIQPQSSTIIRRIRSSVVAVVWRDVRVPAGRVEGGSSVPVSGQPAQPVSAVADSLFFPNGLRGVGWSRFRSERAGFAEEMMNCDVPPVTLTIRCAVFQSDFSAEPAGPETAPFITHLKLPDSLHSLRVGRMRLEADCGGPC